MKIDFVWTDGDREYTFTSKEPAIKYCKLIGYGKVWRREYATDKDGLYILEAVTDITEK